nr:MAG TPA: hypothetical protein [Caudoviricetes sp.]DAP65364.1 MAG TPA: hypothetical protein [Caudoviricetes sp.]
MTSILRFAIMSSKGKGFNSEPFYFPFNFVQ